MRARRCLSVCCLGPPASLCAASSQQSGLAGIETDLVALEQNVKSTFTKAEKDGSLSGVIELKQAVKGVDVTGKIDTKSQLNFVLEHGAALPPPPSSHPFFQTRGRLACCRGSKALGWQVQPALGGERGLVGGRTTGAGFSVTSNRRVCGTRTGDLPAPLLHAPSPQREQTLFDETPDLYQISATSSTNQGV